MQTFIANATPFSFANTMFCWYMTPQMRCKKAHWFHVSSEQISKSALQLQIPSLFPQPPPRCSNTVGNHFLPESKRLVQLQKSSWHYQHTDLSWPQCWISKLRLKGRRAKITPREGPKEKMNKRFVLIQRMGRHHYLSRAYITVRGVTQDTSEMRAEVSPYGLLDKSCCLLEGCFVSGVMQG